MGEGDMQQYHAVTNTCAIIAGCLTVFTSVRG